MTIFVQRRDNKKKEKKISRRALFVWGTALVLFSSVLSLYLGWPRARRFAGDLRESMLGHSYFSVREIKVRGGEKVGGSEIVAMAGLSHGMNIWKIDPGLIEKKVTKHPWVKRLLVRREFPQRVVIEVEEREARGIAALGKLYYVDSEGFVFKAVEEGEKADFPLLTGLRAEDLISQSHSVRQKIHEALKLVDLVGKSLLLSEIHFRPQGGLVLYPMSFPVALDMGWGDWEGKIQRLDRVLSLWKGKENRLAAMDLSFQDQVVARLRPPSGRNFK